MDNTNPPVVTTRQSVVPILERISLSALFSVTDADPDSVVTKYRVRDNGLGGGNFLKGEEVLSANVWHELPGFRQRPGFRRRRARDLLHARQRTGGAGRA